MRRSWRSTWCSPTATRWQGTEGELEKAAGLLGGRLVLADLAMGDGSPRHDPRRLAGAFAQIFEGE